MRESYKNIMYYIWLCVNIGIGGVLLDELSTGLYVISHQHREYLVCLSGIFDGDLLQQAVLGIHGGLPQLLGVHLTKTFVTLGMQCLVVITSVDIAVDEVLTLLLGIAVLGVFLVRALVEGWGGNVEVTALDDLWHEAVEEGHDEGVDV